MTLVFYRRLSRLSWIWMLNFIPVLLWIFLKSLNTELHEHVSKGLHKNSVPPKDSMKFFTELKDSKPKHHVSKLLSTTSCDKRKHKLLFLVTSHPSNFIRRQSIRDSWGSPSSLERDLPNWTTKFIMGIPKDESIIQKVIMEHEMFGDIIFGDFEEVFYNLPHKIHMGFEWSSKYCPTRYIFKADDDIFVNVRNLFTFLYRHDVPHTKLYGGKVHYKPITNRYGKYAVSESEYMRAVYPRFCSGGAMVFSGDVVEALVSAFDSSTIFKLDDVYFGMLALKIGVDPVHDGAFHMYEGASFDDGYRSDVEYGCHYTFGSIASHPVKTRGCMMHHYNNYNFKQKYRIDKDILFMLGFTFYSFLFCLYLVLLHTNERKGTHDDERKIVYVYDTSHI